VNSPALAAIEKQLSELSPDEQWWLIGRFTHRLQRSALTRQAALKFDPRYVWPYKGLLVSQDPVAVDAVGVKLLEVKRRLHFGEDRPFPTLTKHVSVADVKHGIGVSDRERIELVKLGWTADVLI
jgi:hypothetical protein